jgi:hypothetical protein
MRTVPILVAIAFAVLALALLILRPAAALGLGLVGGAVGLVFTQRSERKPRRRSASRQAKPVPAVAPVRPDPLVVSWRPDPVLLEQIREAGWSAEPAVRGAPWVIAAQGPIRVALRPSPRGPRATAEDIAEALAAKESEYAQHAAVVCTQRPDEAVAAAAKQAQVHLVNMARLGAYLTLAGSFRPSAARSAPVKIPA